MRMNVKKVLGIPALALLISSFVMPNYGASFAAAAQPPAEEPGSTSLEGALAKVNALLQQKYARSGKHQESTQTILDEIIRHREALLLGEISGSSKESAEAANKKKDVEFLKKIKKNKGITAADINVKKVKEEDFLDGRGKHKVAAHYKDADGNFYTSRQLDILCKSFPVEMDAPFNPMRGPANDVLKFMAKGSK